MENKTILASRRIGKAAGDCFNIIMQEPYTPFGIWMNHKIKYKGTTKITLEFKNNNND